MTALRYATYLLCLVANGLFINTIGSKVSSRKKVLLSLLMIVANAFAVYFTFPKVLLVAAFWLPGLLGFAVGRAATIKEGGRS